MNVLSALPFLFIIQSNVASGLAVENGTSNELHANFEHASYLQPNRRDFLQITPNEIHVNRWLRQDIPDICPKLCPPNTVQIKEQYCYRYVEKNLSWYDAKKDCEEQGGYLAMLDLHYSNTAVDLSAIYRNIIGKKYIWIGATDSETSMIWKWLSGDILSVTNPFWILGHPGDYKSSCAQIDRMNRGNLQIRKEDCGISRTFLCQFEFPSDSVTTPTSTPTIGVLA